MSGGIWIWIWDGEEDDCEDCEENGYSWCGGGGGGQGDGCMVDSGLATNSGKLIIVLCPTLLRALLSHFRKGGPLPRKGSHYYAAQESINLIPHEPEENRKKEGRKSLDTGPASKSFPAFSHQLTPSPLPQPNLTNPPVPYSPARPPPSPS